MKNFLAVALLSVGAVHAMDEQKSIKKYTLPDIKWYEQGLLKCVKREDRPNDFSCYYFDEKSWEKWAFGWKLLSREDLDHRSLYFELRYKYRKQKERRYFGR